MSFLVGQKAAAKSPAATPKSPSAGWQLVTTPPPPSVCKSKDDKDPDPDQPSLAVSDSGAKVVSIPKSMFHTKRSTRHAKFGMIDIYSVVVTTVSGATSDASGNLPGYFNAGGQLVNSGSWSTLNTAFDIVRLKKAVFYFQPKLGWTTARSMTPLTSTAANFLRVAVDPEGAVASPSVANMLARSPADGPYPCKDHTIVDPFVVTYVPSAPIVRFSATALTNISLHDWMDTGDVTSYAINGTLVGGIVWNVLQAGACPANTDMFGVRIEYHCEFALRNG